METYLYPHAIISFFPPDFLAKRILALALALTTSLLIFANYSPILSWKNPVLVSGKAGENDAVYRFSLVDNYTDALVKINGRSNPLVKLVTLDNSLVGCDRSWQPQVTFNNGATNGPADWWMEFEITFVDKGTYNPSTVNNFDIRGCDLDGNDDKIREYVTLFNLKSYSVESNTLLSVTDAIEHVFGFVGIPGKRFVGPFTRYKNIDTSTRSIMMTGSYQNLNKFCIRTGGVATAANGSTNRMYSLAFQSFNYQPQIGFFLPLVMNSFNALLNNKKVLLNWSTGSEKQLSHFVVERSTDGFDYREIGIVFSTNPITNSVIQNYSFADAMNINTSGILYYRLKMVDIAGRFQNSGVRLIRLNDTNTGLQVQISPNPVLDEVKLTIPSEWQNKRVSYELYNTSGRMIKRIVSSNAVQTEVMNMADCNTGIYVIKTYMNDEISSQTIVKK